MKPHRALHSTLAAVAFAASGANAVYLNPDGLGQALIYPYYTVQSSNDNPFNTYISIANHGDDAKAVRIRFREGRASKEVLGFNLFLKPHDTWAGAVLPSADTAQLGSTDVSCTDPPFVGAPASLPLLPFTRDSYVGDGSGDGYDRLREGFVEAIEMGTLPGGVPANCSLVPGTVAAPTGGLSGSLTLINVASGMDFTVNAEALADLTQQPFFRVASDPYPDFNAKEITPASTVIANGAIYRSVWTRGADAVSAVLMRSAFEGEYILDPATRSHTDWIVTFPTRQFYATSTSAAAPFTQPVGWTPECRSGSGGSIGEPISIQYGNREERSAFVPGICLPAEMPGNCERDTLCASTSVFGFDYATSPASVPAPTAVLGSTTGGYDQGNVPLQDSTIFANGWLSVTPANTFATPPTRLVSQPGSTRIDLATGDVTRSTHGYYGLPATGFFARTFSNGTLTCSEGVCQGNYGGAFRLGYVRRIDAP